MSTPMRPAASQQGRTPSQAVLNPSAPASASAIVAATPPVSTPFSNAAQNALSPHGPKSSPQQVRKSPAALASQPSAAAFNFDSPSTAAAMGALGIPAGFDVAFDNPASLDALDAALADDELLKRLDSILDLFAYKKGYVSEAGLERLARRIGLELLAEDQTTADGSKTRVLAIAGSAISLDIVLDNNIVLSASLAYHGSASAVSRLMDASSKILLADLQLGPNQSPLTKTLDSFASNFEYLANLDKLSILPGLDCFEALTGLYHSLHRLHKWDLQQLRQDPAMAHQSDAFLSKVAMCTRHGLPVMHARAKVGLALHYWRQRRLIPARSEASQTFADTNDKQWSLRIGCAPIDGLGLSPVRVSDAWIADGILRPGQQPDSPHLDLDWLEPDNVSLPPSEDNKDAGMDLLQPDLSTTRVPRVMFTVTLDPPVALPQNDWSRLYMFAGVSQPNLLFGQRGHPPQPPTFDSLFFPYPSGTKADPSEPRSIHCRRQMLVVDEKQQTSRKFTTNTIFIYKPVYAQVVSEMPFSHPRQLIAMFPVLRQYAFLANLLEKSFGSGPNSETSPDSPKEALKTSTSTSTLTAKEQLTRFMAGEADERAAEGKVDAILWLHPSPKMQVVFPTPSMTATVILKIAEGGRVEIVEENFLGVADARRRKTNFTKDDLGKLLEFLEDLGLWADWIRTRLWSVS